MTPLPVPVVLGLFTASGMCALVYQLVWTRWLGLLLGNFATATATVVAVFMAGLAIGNTLSGKFLSGKSPRESLRIYSLLEGGLALLAAISPLVFSSSSVLYPLIASLSPSPFLRAMVCAVLLLPPTILMGATLPSLVQALSAAAPRALGPLYALNTVGGAVGPLLAAFLLMPLLGMKLTVWVIAILNLAVARAAFQVARSAPAQADSPQEGGSAGATATAAPWPSWTPYAFAAASGLTALAFEIALTRLFVLTITGGSVYGFAIILSAFLFGLALGAALLRRWPPRDARSALIAFAITQAVAWIFALTTPFWDLLPPILIHVWWNQLPFALLYGFNFLVVLVLLLVLTTSSGYALPALAAALPGASSTTVGRLFAANTLGAVAGSLGTGFLLLPGLGLTNALLVIGSAALVSAAAAGILALPGKRLAFLAAAPFLIALPFFLPKPDSSVLNAGMYNRPQGFTADAPQGANTPVEAARRLGKIIYEKDSLTARVAVRAVSPQEMSFIVNGKPDGSTNRVDMYTQIFMGHIPAMTHPNPKRALVIGLGTGTTTGSMTLHEGITEIHVAEIEPAQIDVADIFRRHNYDAIHNKRVTIHLDDARHFLATDKTKYDIIVSEPSNLFVSGMVNLFTAEFYQSVREHLNPGGVFFQWIHYYRVAPEDLPGMVATVHTAFPNVMFWLHEYGDAFLLARVDDLAIDMKQWTARLNQPRIAQDLARVGVTPPLELLSFLAWGPRDSELYGRGARICTDDDPYYEFTTPRVRYVPADVAALRMKLQLFAPLEPLPIHPDSPGMRSKLADMDLDRGNLMRALTEYQRAWAQDPGSATLGIKCAYIQWELLYQRDEAITTLKTVLKRNPGNGLAKKKLREIEAAVKQ
jgi:spermidine synthase